MTERMIHVRKCRQCGKEFYVPAYIQEYGYTARERGHTVSFCTYSCMREYEKPIIKKQKRKMAIEFARAMHEEGIRGVAI